MTSFVVVAIISTTFSVVVVVVVVVAFVDRFLHRISAVLMSL